MKHGRSSYSKHGCRCVVCTTAQADYQREYRRSKGAKVGTRYTQAKHGTRAKYVAKCRCEACTEANREYQKVAMRLYRAGLTMKNLPELDDLPERAEDDDLQDSAGV